MPKSSVALGLFHVPNSRLLTIFPIYFASVYAAFRSASVLVKSATRFNSRLSQGSGLFSWVLVFSLIFRSAILAMRLCEYTTTLKLKVDFSS